jgi:hypothetical protein
MLFKQKKLHASKERNFGWYFNWCILAVVETIKKNITSEEVVLT